MIPIENSIEGSVTPVYDLFLDSELKVCGEVIIKIVHCLITNPGINLDAIKAIYSHPQAIGQCRNYLERLNLEMISTYDTAGSVKMIKDQLHLLSMEGLFGIDIYMFTTIRQRQGETTPLVFGCSICTIQ